MDMFFKAFVRIVVGKGDLTIQQNDFLVLGKTSYRKWK